MLTSKLRRRKEGGRHVEISQFFSLYGRGLLLSLGSLLQEALRKCVKKNIPYSVYVKQKKIYIQIADEINTLLFRCFALDTII